MGSANDRDSAYIDISYDLGVRHPPHSIFERWSNSCGGGIPRRRSYPPRRQVENDCGGSPSEVEDGVKAAWDWASPSQWIRWFTDGERRYGKELWKLASVYLCQCETTQTYEYRKVWREGLEVAMKVKGAQGTPHVEWLRQEHPFTAISPQSEVHANHNEAHNSSLRRREACLSQTTEALCQNC